MKSYSIDKPQITTELYSTMHIYSSLTSYILVEYIGYVRHIRTYVKVDKKSWRGYWTWWKSKKYWNVLKASPLQYSCLENPMDRGVWLQSIGFQRVRHDCSHQVQRQIQCKRSPNQIDDDDSVWSGNEKWE